MKGYFIAIEGIDGSGSTTQAHTLVNCLKSIGRKAYFTAEPSLGPVGQLLRTFLGKEKKITLGMSQIMALLFAADRLYHYEKEINPLLEKGIDVVTDRYVLSSIAYQGLLVGVDRIKVLNEHAPEPDLTILLDVDEHIAQIRRKRRGGKREVFDDLETQNRVRECYLKHSKDMGAVVIDGSEDKEEITKQLFSIVASHFQLHNPFVDE